MVPAAHIGTESNRSEHARRATERNAVCAWNADVCGCEWVVSVGVVGSYVRVDVRDSHARTT